MSVSCNHGNRIRDDAIPFLQKFIEKWNPDLKIHLGDNWDLASFRSGADGTTDEADDLEDDLEAGIKFLEFYEPTIFCWGNHDWRPIKLLNHHKSKVRAGAKYVVEQMEAPLLKLHAEIMPYIVKGTWRMIGDTKFGHGIYYNENAARDHAESHGKCNIGHLHRVQRVSGRRDDSAICHVVGYLADYDKMEYAHQRRASLQWENGFAYGEYCDNECVTYLVPMTKDGWRLPL